MPASFGEKVISLTVILDKQNNIENRHSIAEILRLFCGGGSLKPGKPEIVEQERGDNKNAGYYPEIYENYREVPRDFKYLKNRGNVQDFQHFFTTI
ncbi:hypothetical protein [Mobilibacterium timonense]|uniref:hypothetical protein n=1 Tax=Mobilibacterium timonense TaxID=1871012 RepID=UPI001183D242|nr:hypothetical protein [Mobilibacterium timonense]